eukprot:COSAG03_NODE_1420_length_4104_cov_5.628899_5_plen_56_part_01
MESLSKGLTRSQFLLVLRAGQCAVGILASDISWKPAKLDISLPCRVSGCLCVALLG